MPPIPLVSVALSKNWEHSIFTASLACPNRSSQSDTLPTTGTLIIAGDGYAYIVYQYSTGSRVMTQDNCNPTFDNPNYVQTYQIHRELHARLLRAGTDGSSSKIAVGDWTEDSTATNTSTQTTFESQAIQAGELPSRVTPSLITNADQGVLASLAVDIPFYCTYLDELWTSGNSQPATAQNCVDGGSAINLLAVTGGSVTSKTTLPSQITWLQPVLQAQDGTFLGLVNYDWDPADDFLAAFDQSGNIQWSKPGYYAQIATADGGVIAQSYSGQSVTFDANGNATGQLGSFLTQSWMGNAYRLGSVEQVSAPVMDVDGASFWPQVGGNPSGMGTAILQCPCLLQSATATGTNVTTAGTQTTSLIVAGDPGLNLGSGHNHNVGGLFNLAAETLGKL